MYVSNVKKYQSRLAIRLVSSRCKSSYVRTTCCTASMLVSTAVLLVCAACDESLKSLGKFVFV